MLLTAIGVEEPDEAVFVASDHDTFDTFSTAGSAAADIFRLHCS